MKRNFIAILLVCLLVILSLPVSVAADGSTKSTDSSDISGSSNTKAAAQPTPEPSFEPISSEEPIPSFIANPSFAPTPTNEPSPTNEPEDPEEPIVPIMNPRPNYEFRGADEDGLWHSGYYSYPEMSKYEIKYLFDSVDTSVPNQCFDIWPVTQYEPYILGQLSQDSLDKCLAYFNIMRRLGGLNTLELNDEANMYAQYAAWLLCKNQTLTHTPSCQIGVPREFCNNGYYGSSHSNISHSHSLYGFTNWQIDGYMSDRYGINLSEVGHRQEILNPRLVDTGFGSAGWFHTNFVGHRSHSAQIDNYDFIAWPASGNFPSDTEAFERLSPWSVSIDRSNIANPNYYNFSVTVYKNGVEIDELIYGIDPSYPMDPYPNIGRYITIQSTFTNNYCIIFRPDMDGITLDGTFTIVISGLKHVGTQEEFDITYEVNFFKLSDIDDYILGDANCDGEVTSNDALFVLRFTMGLVRNEDFFGMMYFNAEANNDGVLDSSDALHILRMSLGLI